MLVARRSALVRVQQAIRRVDREAMRVLPKSLAKKSHDQQERRERPLQMN